MVFVWHIVLDTRNVLHFYFDYNRKIFRKIKKPVLRKDVYVQLQKLVNGKRFKNIISQENEKP